MTAAQGADDLVGKTAEPFEFRVELGKVREFTRAISSREPAYADGTLTPPTFLMAADHWQRRQNSVWKGVKRNLARTLHAEQEFVFHGQPPAVGTTLQGRSRIDKRYSKEGKRGGTMLFTEVVTEYHDEDGRLVAEVRATTVETSKAANR
ncbi:FAS1-like dehydratase domain-containing protein [Mycolicibacterium sp. XJ1819]